MKNYFAIDWEALILYELDDRRNTQHIIAQTYAYLIRAGHREWGGINEAIIARWSRSGLERVKKMAWKRLEEMDDPRAEGWWLTEGYL